MSTVYRASDVTEDLRFLVTLTNLFEADDKGFWRIADSDEPYKHKLDNNDQGREIVLFQDPLPRGDYLFFNPFAEGFGKMNPVSSLYYKTIRIATNQTLMLVMFHVARAILASKEAAAKQEEYSISSAVVRMSSVPIVKRQTIYDVIDEEMIEEFKTLFERIDDSVVQFPYATQTMTAKLKCAVLTDPDWDTKFGKDIRKKSIGAFKALIMGVLGITKPEELESFSVKYDPDTKSAPRFHSTMSVYLKLYAKFNDIVADAYAVEDKSSERFVVDLDRLANTIERFPAAYAVAKHMIQPVASSVKATDTQTTDTSGLRFGAQPSTGQRRFSNPSIGGPGSLSFGQSNNTFGGGGATPLHTNRFQRNSAPVAQVDPFAPATRSVSVSTPFGGMSPGGMGMSTGGGFGGMSFGGSGGGLSFGGNSGGFDFNAPSNLNFPGTRRNF